jgi:hypothetical protein
MTYINYMHVFLARRGKLTAGADKRISKSEKTIKTSNIVTHHRWAQTSKQPINSHFV